MIPLVSHIPGISTKNADWEFEQSWPKYSTTNSKNLRIGLNDSHARSRRFRTDYGEAEHEADWPSNCRRINRSESISVTLGVRSTYPFAESPPGSLGRLLDPRPKIISTPEVPKFSPRPSTDSNNVVPLCCLTPVSSPSIQPVCTTSVARLSVFSPRSIIHNLARWSPLPIFILGAWTRFSVYRFRNVVVKL